MQGRLEIMMTIKRIEGRRKPTKQLMSCMMIARAMMLNEGMRRVLDLECEGGGELA
jgi:hypothetical protein